MVPSVVPQGLHYHLAYGPNDSPQSTHGSLLRGSGRASSKGLPGAFPTSYGAFGTEANAVDYAGGRSANVSKTCSNNTVHFALNTSGV